ncbi:hypothetical protein Ddye_011992 [Dipteronia dyeriana]|uniref:Uncharacterized protein n=1 Tax=Dipteronia dyeriana TaxID=168575 RepID=A0AAE0CHY7_9ROSI|nr:hypothetical protein Ddye_011992 [Dipteronia dyeriana]
MYSGQAMDGKMSQLVTTSWANFERQDGLVCSEIKQIVAVQASLNLVTSDLVAHCFDLPKFYKEFIWVLKKPHGFIVAWYYTEPQVSSSVDSIVVPFY